MILADTSIWIDHLRQGASALPRLLEESRILMHPFVIGEIALGHLRQRAKVLDLLHALPQAAIASNSEVLALIGERHLAGQGLGYVDVHLLASLLLTPGAKLWSADRALAAAAKTLERAFDASRLQVH